MTYTMQLQKECRNVDGIIEPAKNAVNIIISLIGIMAFSWVL